MAGASTNIAINNDILCHNKSFIVKGLLSLFGQKSPLPKKLVESLLIIPHNNSLPNSYGRGPHIAGWSEHERCQFVVRRGSLFDVHLGDFFAFRGHETFGRARQFESILSPQFFAGQHGILHCSSMGLQILGDS